MARQLFVDEALNKKFSSLLLEKKHLKPEAFREEVYSSLLNETLLQIKSCTESKEILESLYFLGSFSRKAAGVFSDLDLLYFGEKTPGFEAFNTSLRKVFRNYSLKQVESVDEFLEKSDSKGLLSLMSITSVFNENLSPAITDLVSRVHKSEDVESFLRTENQSRHKRFGGRPGRLNYNIKQSPGGVLDLTQLMWWISFKGLEFDLRKEEGFLYKARSLFHAFGDADSLKLNDVEKYSEAFSFLEDQEFFKKFYQVTFSVFSLLQSVKKDENVFSLTKLLADVSTPTELAQAEVELYKVRGVVLSPSYHIWTVDQHILACIVEVKKLIEKYRDEFALTIEEEAILVWSAFFHDLKKGEKESHSVLGAQAAQEFSIKNNWSIQRTKRISWLVREHLTLVQTSFKMDPFHMDFVKFLALRGCEGRKAVLLFILSCADIKATNPDSWSEWKRSVLRTALNRILGVQTDLRSKLQKSLVGNEKGLSILKDLKLKDLYMLPRASLVEDLKVVDEEAFSFYEIDDKYWVRAKVNEDEAGFAEKFICGVAGAGGYIHHAVFVTLQNSKGIYNWACVESGVSLKAFKIRFLHAMKSEQGVEVQHPEYQFNVIRKTFSKGDYAVVSFRGPDEAGAVVRAVRFLNAAGLSIEWGHSVTWGDDIEDVFGVSFSSEPDWKFLTEKVVENK